METSVSLSPGEASAVALEVNGGAVLLSRGADVWLHALRHVARLEGASNDPTCTANADAAAMSRDVQAARAGVGDLLTADAKLALRLCDIVESERLADVRQAGIHLALEFPGNRLSHAMIECDSELLPDEYQSPEEFSASSPIAVLGAIDSLDGMDLNSADLGHLVGMLLMRSLDLNDSVQRAAVIVGATVASQVAAILTNAPAGEMLGTVFPLREQGGEDQSFLGTRPALKVC